MSSTTSFLRSRSTSPENFDDEPKPFDRYLRPDGHEPDRLKYFRRVSRARCLLFVTLFALLGCFLTKGPLGPPYLGGKCQAAIFLAGIPKATSRTTTSTSPAGWMNNEDVVSPEEMATWAKVTHPDELFDKLEKGEAVDSKIIHQSWKTRHDLPARFTVWSREWQRLHGADWRYVLWTDEDNLKLVQRYYPEFLQTYMALPAEIYRADMVRNMYMHRFGGVYADLDLIPLSSLSQHLPVLNSTVPAPMRIAWVGRMSEEAYEHSIPNAWMASSSPGHPFWIRPLAFVRDKISIQKYSRQPEGLTGPVALKTCVDKWQEEIDIRNGLGEYDEVRIIENAKIYPFAWNDSTLAVQCVCDPRNPTFNPLRCHLLYPDAWTITYWTHSWG